MPAFTNCKLTIFMYIGAIYTLHFISHTFTNSIMDINEWFTIT